jgi:hypothetical protein
VADSQVEVGFRELRRELDRLLDDRNCCSGLLLADERSGEVGPGGKVGGRLQGRLAEVLLGPVELAAGVVLQRKPGQPRPVCAAAGGS